MMSVKKGNKKKEKKETTTRTEAKVGSFIYKQQEERESGPSGAVSMLKRTHAAAAVAAYTVRPCGRSFEVNRRKK